MSKDRSPTVYSIPDQYRAIMGAFIRRERTGRGWTLRDMADKTGLSLGYLSQLEIGNNLPSLDSVWMIAASFEYSLAQFFACVDALPGIEEFARRKMGEALAVVAVRRNGNGTAPLPPPAIPEGIP